MIRAVPLGLGSNPLEDRDSSTHFRTSSAKCTIPTVTKSSTTTQANLLPFTTFIPVTSSSESQSPIPSIDTTPATFNGLCASIASSSSNKKLPSATGLMFPPLPAEPSPVPETSTTSNTIPSISQASASASNSKAQTPSAFTTQFFKSKLKLKKKKKKNYLKSKSQKSKLKHLAPPG
ncbi:hypothetical protein TNCV_3373061 [Trichonephila clavipes]|nr:hypothetical protein TNCV_3373061 [Trichonephila clavipes]